MEKVVGNGVLEAPELRLTPKVADAREFALLHHGGQLYGHLPYEVHLAGVHAFIWHCELDEDYEIAAWGHDLLEDTGLTEGYLARRFNQRVARLCWSVCGEGKNRRERQQCILDRLEAFPPGIPLKLGDRTLNERNALLGGDTKLQRMYWNERSLYRPVFVRAPAWMFEEWRELESLYRL